MKKNEGWIKFEKPDKKYFEYMDKLEEMNLPAKDLLFNFPAFAGHVNIGRYLFFYDLYKKVMELNGNMADVGTYKGASFFFFAKLLKLFEPLNTAQVYGFDWFKGMAPGKKDIKKFENSYKADFQTLTTLMELQDLDDIAVLVNMDLTKNAKAFFKERPYLRFKLVFIDCGIEKVLEPCVPLFWERLVPGGIIIFDHYNCASSPQESRIVEKNIGNNIIRQMPFNRQPMAYVIKERG